MTAPNPQVELEIEEEIAQAEAAAIAAVHRAGRHRRRLLGGDLEIKYANRVPRDCPHCGRRWEEHLAVGVPHDAPAVTDVRLKACPGGCKPALWP